MKQERKVLLARLSPVDHQRIVERAELEGRSYGEVIALLLQEAGQARREQAEGASR